MNKIRGLVLKSEPGYVYLLTPEGTYRKVSCRGQEFTPGTEIEIGSRRPATRSRYFAAAAALFLVVALGVLFSTFPSRQEAYLALDINPSLLLSLDECASVVKAEALNPEGEELLIHLELESKSAEEAVGLLLEQAFILEYLHAGRENAVYISLASPDHYALTEDALRLLAENKVKELQINAYLKVKALEMERAADAVRSNVSLNSLALQDELIEKGLWEAPPAEEEDEPPPAPPVRTMLQKAGAENIFSEDEFVAGQDAAGEKPDHAGPNGPAPGPPKQETETEKQGPPPLEQEQEQHQHQQGDSQRHNTTSPTREDSPPEEGEPEEGDKGANGSSGHRGEEADLPKGRPGSGKR